MIDTLGTVDGEHALLDRLPGDMGVDSYRMAEGVATAGLYPADAWVPMSKKYRGVKLASILGNTHDCLMVEKKVREIIEQHCGNVNVEYLPFVIRNVKNRVQSEDYVIINPVGTFDCLDVNASQIKYLDAPGDAYHGSVVDVFEYVLDAAKVKKAPHLFRPREKPNRYILSEALVTAFRKAKFTNVVLTELAQAGKST
jgi:hypothetical protein